MPPGILSDADPKYHPTCFSRRKRKNQLFYRVPHTGSVTGRKVIWFSASQIIIVGTIVPGKMWKCQNFSLPYMCPKLDKNNLQGLKNLRKTICNVLEATLDENLFFEKKVIEFTYKYRNFRYFWSFKISLVTGTGRWLAKCK